MFIIIGYVLAIAAIYHGINFILLFKQALPAILVSLLMGVAFVIALPFVPFASIYSAGKQGLHLGYCVALFLTYCFVLWFIYFSFSMA
jgi:hypothetical protein